MRKIIAFVGCSAAKPHVTTVEIHAGELYCKPLDSILRSLGFTVVRPVESLAIGKQLQFYSNFQKSIGG